jgi:hypothetical protein
MGYRAETSVANYQSRLHNILDTSWTVRTLKTGAIVFPETSVNNYKSTLHNITEERRPQL